MHCVVIHIWSVIVSCATTLFYSLAERSTILHSQKFLDWFHSFFRCFFRRFVAIFRFFFVNVVHLVSKSVQKCVWNYTKQPQKWEWTLNLCRKICLVHGKLKMWIFLFAFFGVFSYFWWVFIALAMFEVNFRSISSFLFIFMRPTCLWSGRAIYFFCSTFSFIYCFALTRYHLSIIKWYMARDSFIIRCSID